MGEDFEICSVNASYPRFSLHAGVASEAYEPEKLERLRRYIMCPAVTTERLSLTVQRNIRYRLKTP